MQLTNTYKVLLAACLLVVIGAATYHGGLNNPFMGDDNSQIVLNAPVQSISNIKLFFEGGTFYSGQPSAPLTGAYYRPLMTTTFSLLYSLFGPHQYYFHFFQLALGIGSAILLFLLFRYVFSNVLSFVLALVFLIHPLNSQVLYAIPSMQDALFFFFGIAALYTLIRLRSRRSLALPSILLFVSLLAKETAILFMVMGIIYLLWKDRRRLGWFIAMLAVLLALYLILRVNAIGWLPNPHNAPIASLPLAKRLLTAPSIMAFYIVRFVYPAKLASAYHWTYTSWSFDHVDLPLLLAVATVAAFVSLGWFVRRNGSQAQFQTYLFFAVWTALGLGMLLQVLPLDMTASENWAYFPMVGILGMLGVIITVITPVVRPYIDARAIAVLTLLLLLGLGIRTAERAKDWQSPDVLAQHDVIASPDDYVAQSQMAIYYYDKAQYKTAQAYAEKSVAIYHTATNSNILGTIQIARGNFYGAAKTFNNGLGYPSDIALYDSLASLTAIIHVYGSPAADRQFLLKTLKTYPEDANVWFCLAVLDSRGGDATGAKASIKQAYHLAPTNEDITVDYFRLMLGKPLYYTFNRDPVPY